MGAHTVERVPLDFDWPLDEIWKGYVNPHYVPCDTCDGDGDTVAAHWLSSVSYILAMLGEWAADERGAHPWLNEFPLAPHRIRKDLRALYPRMRGGPMPPPDAYETQRPGQDMVDLLTGLVRDAKYPRRDSLFTRERHYVYKAILKAAGMPTKWGVCPDCKGSGVEADHYKDYKRWRSKKPPRGRGWQVWENVSEGAPITPVFATADDLVDYLCTKGTTWDQKRYGKGPWRREAAVQFVKDMGSPSLVTFNSGTEVTAYEGGRDADKIAEHLAT